jgi:hypothetical protein
LIRFPPRSGDAAVLQEGVSNHRHKSVTVKTAGPSLEVIETEFLFQLLIANSHFSTWHQQACLPPASTTNPGCVLSCIGDFVAIS